MFSASNKQNQSTGSEINIKYIEHINSIQTLVIQSGVIRVDAYIPDNSIVDNNWHNYTLVSDNVGAIEIYIDGVAQALYAGTCCGGTTNDYFFGDIPGLSSMKIGMLERDVLYSFGSFSIDDFRIWDKALSSSEIVTSIASASVPPVTNLVVYYDFESQEDLGVGISGVNDIRDQTGNTVHGDYILGVTTGILNSSQAESTSGIKLYPNPSGDLVTVECDIDGTDQITGKLTDNSGKVFMTWSESASIKYSKQLNISSLPSGVYFVQLNGEKTNKSVKVVKQ